MKKYVVIASCLAMTLLLSGCGTKVLAEDLSSVETDLNSGSISENNNISSSENNEDNDKITGWIKENGNWYYILGNGDKARNTLVGDYWLDDAGCMVVSQWVNTGDREYYFDATGKKCKMCFCKINGEICYFDEIGEVDNSSGLKKQGPDWYFMGEDGSLCISQEITGIGYFDEEGKLKLYSTIFDSPLGLQYYDEEGKAVFEKVVEVNGILTYFDSLGLRNTSSGWKKSGEDWYYIDKEGEFVTNAWVIYNYLGEDGRMVKNQYVDRYYINEKGSWDNSFTERDWKIDGEWQCNEDIWYFIEGNGKQSIIDFSEVRSIARCGYDYENPETPPEQSYDSYVMAKDKGFDVLLCNLRFTADGVPVCFHYDKINKVARDSNGSEIKQEYSIEELTYEELEKYDWGIYKGEKYRNTKLLSFSEMMSIMKELDTEVYVEIKSGNEEQIVNAVNIAKEYELDISWAGMTLEQCQAVIKADETARVATMPWNISEHEVEELLTLYTGKNKVFFFAYNTAILDDKALDLLLKNDIPFEMGTINTVEEIVNYWNGNYQYCSGIESNCIVAASINLDEFFSEKREQ